MRKITKEAVSAFLEKRQFSKGNTSVFLHDTGVELALHGNCIASIEKDGMYITNAGWFSNTTKERLNGLPGVRIHQKNKVWYLNGKEWTGEWTKI